MIMMLIMHPSQAHLLSNSQRQLSFGIWSNIIYIRLSIKFPTFKVALQKWPYLINRNSHESFVFRYVKRDNKDLQFDSKFDQIYCVHHCLNRPRKWSIFRFYQRSTLVIGGEKLRQYKNLICSLYTNWICAW